jgi:SpoVK/Ycf46/Vps4 family AAA+-type ATPase
MEDAKQILDEAILFPMKRPDLYTGLRAIPKGVLLFGPPGTGKTLIAKSIAHQSNATFFSISSSSLTSKWIGEGEKLVRTLFALAAYRQPSVVFIDEVDSLLTQRKATDNEASRRIKTEFLVQLDGAGTSAERLVLLIGATNRPQELDEAARRRFIKRLYIRLPNTEDRRTLLTVMLKKNKNTLTDTQIRTLAEETEAFSGADLKSLCTDAAMGPIRELGAKALNIDPNDVPPISYKHFKKSLRGTRPSVAPGDLEPYEEFDRTYGSHPSNQNNYEDDDDEEEDV